MTQTAPLRHTFDSDGDPTVPEAPPQLTFEIDSNGTENTIFVTADASQNDLVLKIGTTASASFAPAPKVVDQPQAAAATGSLLYLDLTPLALTTAEFAAITPVTTGWTFATFPSDHLIGMTPTAATTLAAGDTITLTIGALACAQAPGASASLTVTAYRVGGITLGNLPFPTNLSVALATPPVGGDNLADDLMVDLATPTVVNSVDGYDPVANQLAFAFYPGLRGRPITPTAESQLTLSFVYATDPSGYGALCTPDEVKPPFEVIGGVGAGQWKITPNRSQESPSWTLHPPTTGPIVKRGTPVAILANNLITKFQPGPTVAVISYSGFEGYADGEFTLPIEKVGHVRIDALKVQPNPSELSDGAASITVSWTVANAGTMTLQPFDVDVTGKTHYTGPITKSGQISLTAEGTALASAGNIALRNKWATVLPVINSFDASPRALYSGDLPREVNLSWNVNTNEQLKLVSSAAPPDPTRYAAQGQVGKEVDGPQLFTLVPLGQTDTDVQRSILVSAFEASTKPTSVVADSIAAPPNGSFIVAADSRGTVGAYDTMVFAPVSSGVPCGAGPAGMVFSADGSLLYIANSADGTVSVVAVAATGQALPYSFTTQSTIQVGGAPERLALSPDGKYLYVSSDGGSKPGQLVVIATATETVVSRLNVGVAPRGVAVLPSGAQIFVANSGSSTVTVIGRSPGGHHSVVDRISGVSSAQDVAVSTDGNVLFVACPTAGSVYAINAVYPQAPRAELGVGTGASPQQLAVFPGGGYVAVANAGTGTVSLLASGPTPSECRVVDVSMASVPNAEAVAVTPDGGLVLVGAGRSGTSVVTLAEYETATMTPALGGQPTDVAFASDGESAVAWHNARLSFSAGQPSKGVSVFDVDSGTIAPELSDVAVVGVALAPVAEKSAFVINATDASVSVVDTDSWAVKSTIDLSGQTSGLPVAIAASADASTVFVLAGSDQECDLVILGIRGTPGAFVPIGTVKVLASPSPGSLQTLSVAPDGSAAYITDQAASELIVVAAGDDGTYALKGQPIQIGILPLASAVSPDGTTLFVASEGLQNGSLASVDTATMAVTSVVLPPNSQTSLQRLRVSPDGTRVFATDAVAAGVRIFDAASLRLVQSIPLAAGSQFPNGVTVAPDGSRALTANTNSATLGVITQVQSQAATPALRQPTPLTAPAQDLLIPEAAGSYEGFFIRDQLGQTPSSGGVGSTDCPDIWPSGQAAIPNPQTTLVDSYATTDSPNVIFTSGTGVNNWVYVRGQNATSGAASSRIWFYYVNGGGDPSMILWPPNWINTGVKTQNTQNTWTPVSSAAANEIDYTQDPFLWSSTTLASGHYCMLAWADNQPLSSPAVDPRAGIGSIGTMNDLGAFIANHQNFGWKNTVDQPTPTGESWELVLPFAGPPRGGLFRVGLQFTGMPTPGVNDPNPASDTCYFSFSLQGPNIPTRPIPASANVQKSQITSADETFMVPLDWTGADGYNTNMVVTFWAPNNVLPAGANLQIVCATGASGLVGLTPDPLVGAVQANVYPTGCKADGFEQEWITIIGQVQVNPVQS